MPTWDSGGAHLASEADTWRSWVTFGSSLTCEGNTHLQRQRQTMASAEKGPPCRGGNLRDLTTHSWALIPVHTLSTLTFIYTHSEIYMGAHTTDTPS